MDKRAIRNFATKARRDLIEQIILRARELGVTEKACAVMELGPDYVAIGGTRYPIAYKSAYERLCNQWRTQGFAQLVEEVAYTWFNRLIALRYMEIHDYLPSHLRVLSSAEAGGTEPQVLAQYRDVTFSVQQDRLEQAVMAGDREGAYRQLLIGQCNELHRIMPFMFEHLADYTELLLPSRLLHADSIVLQLVRTIAEDDFAEVEIIGWMYQFYISEKQKAIVGMNKGFVSKEDLPAATQLFTPDWIVRYMVQNSLGRLWNFDNGQVDLRSGWELYLEPSFPRGSRQPVRLEDIRILDPACGSGHVLVYAFDLLYDMYESQGYLSSDIPQLILTNNLYGLDIDRRAAQLAAFALLMKARSKDRRIFSREPHVHIQDFAEFTEVSDDALELLCKTTTDKNLVLSILESSRNAKMIGSLMTCDAEVGHWTERIGELKTAPMEDIQMQALIEELWTDVYPILRQYQYLQGQYDVVATNPPYHNKYSPELKDFLGREYKDYKADLYSAFVARCVQLTKQDGYAAMMTPLTWMFISTHEKLRRHVLRGYTITGLVQLEYSAFEEATVPICTFVVQNQRMQRTGEYVRLANFRGAEMQPIKVMEAARDSAVSFRFSVNQDVFSDIPGSPIAYWASDRVREIFRDNPKLGEIAEPKHGLTSGDNDRFFRLWHEVDVNLIGLGISCREEAQASKLKWFPLNKGGEFRKWYGNQDYVIDWHNDGEGIRGLKQTTGKTGARIDNAEFYFREGITWTDISSSKFGVRYSPVGFISDQKGSCIYPTERLKWYLTAFLCSSVCKEFIPFINPTISFQVGYISMLPIIIDEEHFDEIELISKNNVKLSKEDWDDWETSWNFSEHAWAMVSEAKSIEEAFSQWEQVTEDRFTQLRDNENILNQSFAEIYGLDAKPVADEDITVARADRTRDTKAFFSYFIGCVMGRYSLDHEGLAYAGGAWNASRYQRFQPDADGIIPLTDEEYFEDDLVRRLQVLLITLYGEDTLQENISWLAESIGGAKSGEHPIDRLRRYFCDDFFKDHLKTYSKRPIYWLFDSGKKKAFRALLYMHRYDTESVARVRLQYVQVLQRQYVQEIALLNQRLAQGQLSTVEKTNTNKRLSDLEERQVELADYDQRLAGLASDRVPVDLDDGVVVNYAKFADVLAPLK